ncbi:hypothetical protein FGB62_243g021 [Gracilaria domingensis]|nr:hypothetical protein FGB62_243g021 [Gracilaria domingensis]
MFWSSTCDRFTTSNRGCFNAIGALGFGPGAACAGGRNAPVGGFIYGDNQPNEVIIRTNGTRVFLLRHSSLFILRISIINHSPATTGTLSLPLSPREMSFYNEHLLLVARSPHILPNVCIDGTKYAPDSEWTVVFQVKVVNDDPELIATLCIQGKHLKAIEDGEQVRLLTSYKPDLCFAAPNCSFPCPQSDAYNLRVLQTSAEQDWHQSYSLKTEGQDLVQTGSISPCDRILKSSSEHGSLISEIILPISEPLIPTGRAYAPPEEHSASLIVAPFEMQPTGPTYPSPPHPPRTEPEYIEVRYSMSHTPDATSLLGDASLVAASSLAQKSTFLGKVGSENGVFRDLCLSCCRDSKVLAQRLGWSAGQCNSCSLSSSALKSMKTPCTRGSLYRNTRQESVNVSIFLGNRWSKFNDFCVRTLLIQCTKSSSLHTALVSKRIRLTAYCCVTIGARIKSSEL